MLANLPPRIRARADRFHSVRVGREWGGRMILHGKRKPSGAIEVDSNDYLALTGDTRITGAMREALVSGATLASGVFLHGEHPQLRLENDLATFLDAPAGVLCQSGLEANVGLLQAICDAETPVYIDYLAHMSLWQGAKLAGAPVHPFRHNDAEQLRAQVDKYGPGVIAVDSLYSTNGSRAPLVELCAVAADTGSVLVVDESHTLGIYGPDGAGLVVEENLADRVHFRTASLSKAFGGRAGFITAPDRKFADYFKMESYPAIFSSTLQPHDIAGLAAALAVIRGADQRRSRLREVGARLRNGLRHMGFDLEDSVGQIIPVLGGPEQRTMAVRDLLEEHNVFGSVFCAPATSQDRAIIRLSLHAALTDDDVDQILTACRTVRDTLGARPPVRLRRAS
ncbi:alpha-hydroxyketone-type quorum-sensing autoinducer synthase [Nocardia tengchongensis]|uniref:alpha-hydroxyketone-type quorum-sensing autoinducer synthase n=1 Tax=Nocardia tengchongensis TaxID=2055889 RepID=UPI00365BB138